MEIWDEINESDEIRIEDYLDSTDKFKAGFGRDTEHVTIDILRALNSLEGRVQGVDAEVELCMQASHPIIRVWAARLWWMMKGPNDTSAAVFRRVFADGSGYEKSLVMESVRNLEQFDSLRTLFELAEREGDQYVRDIAEKVLRRGKF